MNRLLKSTLITACLAGLCGAAHADSEPVTFTVDFTFTSGASVEQIYDEIEATAKSACLREARQVSSRPSERRRFIPGCREQLVDLAVSRIGRPELAALHSRETGTPMPVGVYAQLD